MILNQFFRLSRITFRDALLHRILPCSLVQKPNYSTSVKTKEDENAPVKYTTSPAGKWRARATRVGDEAHERLWYEPYVILGSITIFMVYFTILREENDIDAEFTRTLFSRVPQLEEQQLKQALEYAEAHHLDISREIKHRLQEIETQKRV